MTIASSSRPPNASGSTVAPSPTLFVKNIEGKVKKPELRRQLYSLFSTYGTVLDVVATRAPSMRGQAFIVFENPTTSTAAKRGLSGFSFYGNQLHIEYSHGEKSKALLRRELGDDAVQEMDLERSHTTVSRRGEKRLLLSNNDDENASEAEAEHEAVQAEQRKRAKLEQDDDANDAAAAVVKAIDIPTSIEHEVISALFSRQTGYLSVAPSSPTNELESEAVWTALIRFDSKSNAEAARQAMDAIQIDPTYKLDLVVL